MTGFDPPGWWRDIANWAGGNFSHSADKIADGVTSREAAEQARRAATTDAPIIWLLGKVQSGKSSIVQRLTGATEAKIGNSFRAMTRTAVVFDFPAEAPVLRFLDTRGLGEKGYDPSEDLAACENKAHLLIVVMRADDLAQEAVIEALRGVRGRHPDWPVIVAQTWLHSLYPHPPAHPQPYPFTGGPQDADLSGVPPNLSRVLTHQRGLFEAIPGSAPIRFVPLDFTRPHDGLPPEDYGLELLLAAIVATAPEAVHARLSAMRSAEGDQIGTLAHSRVLGYAFAAAAADAVPLIGAVAVPTIQGAMLHGLADHFGTAWSRADIIAFVGSLGTATIVRQGLGFGLRQLVKLIPVYGQIAGATAAAAASFAFTYALGRAACVYLPVQRDGEQPFSTTNGDRAGRKKDVLEAYTNGLREAFDVFRPR
jgi:uncharacterized protein (DUF697 family)